MLLDVLTVLVLGFVGARLVASARAAVRSSELRRRTLDIVRDVRPAHVLRALPVLAVVLVLASLSLAVPVLRTGWWTAIGGTGNIVTGATDRTRGTPLAWLVPALFLALLVPLLPLFAEREEQIFRAGAESWSFWRRVRRGLEFGLAHVIMGIPIGVALALSVGGWYFTWMYLRAYRRGGRTAALMESTRSHLAYNAVVFAILLLALALA